MTTQEKVSDRLRKVRKALRLTQKELARQSGLDRTTITKIETGEQEKNQPLLLFYAKQYHISAAYMLNGSGEMIEPSIDGVQPNLDGLADSELTKKFINSLSLTEEEAKHPYVQKIIMMATKALHSQEMEKKAIEARIKYLKDMFGL